MSHAQRAEYLRAIAARLRERTEDIGQIWPRESGVLHAIARRTGAGAARTDRAREVDGQLRSGTVGHNAFRTDFGIAFGGFKQSGIGREGGREGLLPFLETKTVILEGRPAGY